MLSSPFSLKITEVRAMCVGRCDSLGLPSSAHRPFGEEECAHGLKKGPGARGARAADLSWANLGALLSSCHLQSQGIKGGGARREWEGGSSRWTPNLGSRHAKWDIKELEPREPSDRDFCSPGKREFRVGLSATPDCPQLEGSRLPWRSIC